METKPKTDKTRAARQSKRQAALNAKAQAAGWPSWSAYETAVINGTAPLDIHPPPC